MNLWFACANALAAQPPYGAVSWLSAELRSNPHVRLHTPPLYAEFRGSETPNEPWPPRAKVRLDLPERRFHTRTQRQRTRTAK